MEKKRNPIMRFFSYQHLQKQPLRDISKACCDLAMEMERMLPDNAERSAGLRKLLEAKDCFVRAAIPENPEPKD